MYDANATPPVDCCDLSYDEQEGYKEIAEDWRKKGVSYLKKAVSQLRKKQHVLPKVLSNLPVSNSECDCVQCVKGLF